MIKRLLSGALGAMAAVNGAAMLVAGEGWYAATPGVSDTGPFNPHFVADVGVAYLVAGLALCARAWRDRLWPAAFAGAAFFAGHAVIHLAGIFAGMFGDGAHHAGFETALVILPAALSLWAATPDAGRADA